MDRHRPKAKTGCMPLVVVFVCIVAYFSLRGGNRGGGGGSQQPGPGSGQQQQSGGGTTTSPATIEAVKTLISASGSTERKDGIAVAVLVDTSGSMSGAVPDSRGGRSPKIEIARRAVVNVVRQVEGFAKEKPDRPVLLGVYEFSGRDRSSARQVLPFAPPSIAAAESAVRSLRAEGNTPIGDAMIEAKRGLDATGLARTHIIVVSDGENTSGYGPADVAYAISALSAEQRPGLYFVAFDVAAAVFNEVKNAGAMILPAANEKDLQQTLDYLIGQKVLLEE